jgi:hypothetical protein
MPRAQDDDDAKFEAVGKNRSGYFALPGQYSVELAMAFDGETKPLAGPVTFNAITLNNKTIPVSDPEKLDQFYADLTDLRKTYDATVRYYNTIQSRNENIRQALHMMPESQPALENQTREFATQLNNIDFVMNGTSPKASFEEVPPEPVSLRYRLGAILSGTWAHSGDPTQTMLTNYTILKEELAPIIDQLSQIDSELNTIENQLDELGAPYTPGRKPKLK